MVRKLMSCALSLICAAGLGAADVQGQIDVSGSVDFYYQYSFNKQEPLPLRTFDMEHNSLTLSYAEVVLSKAPTTMSRIGGRVDLGFGPAADLVASGEPGVGDETFRNLQQAYISVMANDQVTIDFGKFVTPIGAEVIESQGNWNYSRSTLFGYAIPFYHAGARVSYAASEQLTLAGYVVNGWNNVVDNNDQKTFIASAALMPNDQMTWYGNFIVGKEGNFGGSAEEDLGWLFDTTLSYAATDMVTVMANFDYGSIADAGPTAGDPAKWWGIAAYARIQPQANWGVAGRFEYIDDTEGDFMGGLAQKAQTVTVTSDHRIFEDLIARVEFRFDTTENDFFTDADANPSQNQPSIGVGMVYELN